MPNLFSSFMFSKWVKIMMKITKSEDNYVVNPISIKF